MSGTAKEAARRIKDRFHEEVGPLSKEDYRAVMDDVIDHIEAHRDGLDEEELNAEDAEGEDG